MNLSDSSLVYSTNPEKNKTCPQCKRLMAACTCSSQKIPPSFDVTAVLRIEKAGRAGKVVTVIDQLPKSEKFLKELAKKLKTRCGAGGTYLMKGSGGQIEIQGDQREAIRPLLQKEGLSVKG